MKYIITTAGQAKQPTNTTNFTDVVMLMLKRF